VSALADAMRIDGGLTAAVRRALDEDLGAGDITSAATVPADARARAVIVQKQAGVIYGLDVAALTFELVDTDVRVERIAAEGEWREAGGEVLAASGNARSLLAAERTALNFLGRLSGIATLTAQYVGVIAGTGAQILDTRKTTPGLRALEKAAVAAGGGVNHRFGLDDAVLIKENHSALAGGVGAAVRAAAAQAPALPLVVEVCDAAEIDAALAAGAPRLLLDNMSADELRDAVARVAGRAVLEASGGVTLENVREVAESGVEFISVGALTHSAAALDMSLLLAPVGAER
jgi:nicotinate-nucleotide pyrophosphorylase (carboxylating)